MTKERARGRWIHCIALVFGTLCMASAQCPQLPTSSASGNANILCEGSSVTFSVTGVNLPIGSNVDWYLFTDGTQNPYNGEGTLIGSAPVTGDPCNNPPEVLYIMVNPDNTQVGGPGDECDEFLVLWTGSGGFSMNDITISNLGPGTSIWDNFAPGNASTFSCGIPLPPGPIPANAILIIQSSPNNNVTVNDDVLCSSGLPVYIITYTGTVSCMFGYFDNNSPCSSCPINFMIDGTDCDYAWNPTYTPPANSIDGWAWANTGAGVYANVVPPLDIPVFVPPVITVDDFVWTVPSDFCETMGGGDYWVAGIPDPPPSGACPDVITSYFGLTISCPELILSGGGDVCEGNCPDSPTEISFELIGNDVPFTADLIVMASVFPPFPINGLPITNGYTIEVCLGGGIFPSFDPATGILTVPSLAIGITATVQIVSLVSNAGCPVSFSPGSVSLTFIAAPAADAGPDQMICEGETVDLSGSIGGSATASEWSTDGDGDFNDPTDLNAQYTPGPNDIANGSVTLTLTGTDANGSCIPAESMMVITIQPSISVSTNTPQTICNNDVANIIATLTGGTASFTWETSGDGNFDDPAAETTIYTPGPSDINSGSVTLTFTPDNPSTCVSNIEPLVISIVAAPQVTTPQSLEVCIGDSAVFSISVQGAFSTITWSTNGDGTLMVVNDVDVTYDPGPQDIAGQFVLISVTVQSSFPACGSTTYNIPINLNDCNCPDLETIPPSSPLCSASGVLDLNTLLVAGDPGNWALVSTPPGVNPAILSGSNFIVNNSDPGTYVVSYNVSVPQPGCPASSTETILVNAPVVPEAGPDQTFCGPGTVLLNGIFTPLSALTFQWETNGDGMFDDNQSFSTNYHPGHLDSLGLGVFLSLHVMDTVCGEQVDTMNAFFNAAPFATFSDDTVIICNETVYGSVLNFNLLITGGDIAGTWTNISGVPVNFSNPAAVDFNGIAEGYYAFGYQTNSAIFPCTEKNYIIYVDVQTCSCPLLILNNPPAGICNSLTSLPLDAFIMAGAPGTWQILSTPPGSNTATLNGSVLAVNGVDQGDYRFRFTFNGAPLDGCVDSAEFTIFIQDQPSIVLQKDTAFCGGAIFPVTGNISGSATNFQWATTGGGFFAPTSGSPSTYQPSALDVASGQVYLLGTTQDTFGFCTSDIDSIKVNFSTPPFATLSQLSTSVCNNPDSGSIVNLSSFVIGGDVNGIWGDVNGTGVNLSNPAAVDFDGSTPGAHLFSYITNSAVAPCMDSVYFFSVIVRNCSCPDLILSQTGVILCVGETYDLNAEIINAAPGSWMVSSGPPGSTFPQIAGSTLNTANTTKGNYILTYTLTDSVPNCPASSGITLTVEELPTLFVEGKPCDASHNFYSVIFTSDANLIVPNFGKLKTISAGKYSIDSIPSGQDVKVDLTSTLGACTSTAFITAPNCNCALMIEDLVDTLTLCPGDSFRLIPFVTGAAGFPMTYWINIVNQDTVKHFSFEVSQPGTYVWVVIDTLMCEERDTFTSVFIGPTSIDFTSIPPTCPNETDGEIIINGVADGLPPYSIQLDNGAPVAVGLFPYTISSVDIGQHVVALTDLTGCTFEQPVSVINNSFGNINLGPDITITKGDSAFIQPIITNIGVSQVQWNLPTLPPDLSPFWIKPDTTTLLQVTVTDTSGCIYTDDLVITLFERASFFIPNVFSPNGDQINDQVIVNTNIPDDRLVSFEIFDRWGGMLYRQQSGQPFAWDGKADGKYLNPGVYVYKLVYQDENGKQQVMVGDITLIR